MSHSCRSAAAARRRASPLRLAVRAGCRRQDLLSQALLRQLQRARHGAALGENLLVLRGRYAVGDDPRARLIAVLVASENQGADGDRMIHVTARAEVADRAAVEAAADRLQLVDDLHGTHFR